jgi:5-methylcytosine-specific restriction endonuclease McrA
MSDSTCRWPECERPATTKGFCPRDYQRGKREGNYKDPWTTWAPVKPVHVECRWPGCDVPKNHGNGLCKPHYQRARNVGDMSEPWKLWNPGGHCIVCGKWRDGAIFGQRFCSSACNMLDWKKRNPERVRELGREHVRRRRARMLSTQVEKFTDKDIRMAHGDICYLCGEGINFKLKFPHPKSRSVDHVIPLSRGGSHTLENCAMVHYQCNQIKNARDATSAPMPTLFAL